jgi:hypothetical protein
LAKVTEAECGFTNSRPTSINEVQICFKISGALLQKGKQRHQLAHEEETLMADSNRFLSVWGRWIGAPRKAPEANPRLL